MRFPIIYDDHNHQQVPVRTQNSTRDRAQCSTIPFLYPNLQLPNQEEPDPSLRGTRIARNPRPAFGTLLLAHPFRALHHEIRPSLLPRTGSHLGRCRLQLLGGIPSTRTRTERIGRLHWLCPSRSGDPWRSLELRPRICSYQSRRVWIAFCLRKGTVPIFATMKAPVMVAIGPANAFVNSSTRGQCMTESLVKVCRPAARFSPRFLPPSQGRFSESRRVTHEWDS
jgi:hypothetical protein